MVMLRMPVSRSASVIYPSSTMNWSSSRIFWGALSRTASKGSYRLT